MSEQPFDSTRFAAAARRGWDEAAMGWKRWAPAIERAAQTINDRLVEMAGIGPGDHVLDVATGYGEPLVTILDRVGPAGRAVATDISPEMIALARERPRRSGLTNATFHVSNAESLEIPEVGFDAAVCRWGIMLMADPDACLRRLHERLRPGGAIALAVFGEPAKTPWLSVAGGTVRRELGLGPPPPDEPGIFRFADGVDLERRLAAAGFERVVAERVGGAFVVDSAESYVRFLQERARDIVKLLEDERPERQEAIWQAVAEEARQYQRKRDGVSLPFECHCIATHKPG